MKDLQELLISQAITVLIAGFHWHLLHHNIMMSIAMGMIGSIGYFLYIHMPEEARNKKEIRIAFIVMIALLLVG